MGIPKYFIMPTLNKFGRCYVCHSKRYNVYWKPGNDKERFIKHHISYFPSITCWVHDACHKLIHDPEKPLTQFIKYTKHDVIKYYKQKTHDLAKHEVKVNPYRKL